MWTIRTSLQAARLSLYIDTLLEMQRLTKMVSFNRRGSGLNSQNEINVEDSEDAHYFSPERNEEIEVEENISK